MAYEVGTRPPFNFWRANLTTSNQIAAAVGVPERAQVLSIGCFIAGSSGQTAQYVLCIWHGNGNLIARTDQFGSGPGGASAGGQRWEVRAPQGAPILDPGSYWVGWWRLNTTWGEFSFQSGVGSFQDQSTGGGIASMGGSAQSGNIGRVLTIEPAPIEPPPPPPVFPTARVWDGSGWRESDAVVWNGSAWVVCDAYVWNGSAWVPTG